LTGCELLLIHRYGDLPLTSASSRAFAAAYALLSVGTLSAVFGGLGAARKEAEAERHFRLLLRKELDPAMIEDLDQVHDRIARPPPRSTLCFRGWVLRESSLREHLSGSEEDGRGNVRLILQT